MNALIQPAHYEALLRLPEHVTGEVIAYLNKRNIPIENFFISPSQLAMLVNMIEKNEISNKQGRDIFQEMLTN